MGCGQSGTCEDVLAQSQSGPVVLDSKPEPKSFVSKWSVCKYRPARQDVSDL